MNRQWIALGLLCVGTITSCTPTATEQEKSRAKTDEAPAQGQAAIPDDLDVVILNGRVIDPETNFDAVRNVGVKGGRIAVITKEEIQGKETRNYNELAVWYKLE